MIYIDLDPSCASVSTQGYQPPPDSSTYSTRQLPQNDSSKHPSEAVAASDPITHAANGFLVLTREGKGDTIIQGSAVAACCLQAARGPQFLAKVLSNILQTSLFGWWCQRACCAVLCRVDVGDRGACGLQTNPTPTTTTTPTMRAGRRSQVAANGDAVASISTTVPHTSTLVFSSRA